MAAPGDQDALPPVPTRSGTSNRSRARGRTEVPTYITTADFERYQREQSARADEQANLLKALLEKLSDDRPDPAPSQGRQSRGVTRKDALTEHSGESHHTTANSRRRKAEAQTAATTAGVKKRLTHPEGHPDLDLRSRLSRSQAPEPSNGRVRDAIPPRDPEARARSQASRPSNGRVRDEIPPRDPEGHARSQASRPSNGRVRDEIPPRDPEGRPGHSALGKARPGTGKPAPQVLGPANPSPICPEIHLPVAAAAPQVHYLAPNGSTLPQYIPYPEAGSASGHQTPGSGASQFKYVQHPGAISYPTQLSIPGEVTTPAGYVAVRPDPRPLHPEMYAESAPANYKVPKITPYTGTEDPIAHVQHFIDQIDHLGWSDAMKCRAFVATLNGLAKDWYIQLPTASICSFLALRAYFEERFRDRIVRNKDESQLEVADQKPGESLKSYYNRFDAVLATIRNWNPTTAFHVLKKGLQKRTPLTQAICVQNIRTYAGLVELIKRHITLEEVEGVATPNPVHGSASSAPPRTNTTTENKGQPKTQAPASAAATPTPSKKFDLSRFAPLTAPREQILMEIGQDLGWPSKLDKASEGKRRRSGKYCNFHKDHGHITEECFHLAQEIDRRVRRGSLQQYALDRGRVADRLTPAPQEEPWRGQEILTISGGQTSAPLPPPPSRTSDAKKAKYTPGVIEFGDRDLGNITVPHEDALVISAIIDGAKVHRIMVDTGASANVLYAKVWNQLKSAEPLAPCHEPLVAFGGAEFIPLGVAQLPLTLGYGRYATTKAVPFTVVNT